MLSITLLAFTIYCFTVSDRSTRRTAITRVSVFAPELQPRTVTHNRAKRIATTDISRKTTVSAVTTKGSAGDTPEFLCCRGDNGASLLSVSSVQKFPFRLPESGGVMCGGGPKFLPKRSMLIMMARAESQSSG